MKVETAEQKAVRLEKEVEGLKAQLESSTNITFKVGDKGGLSMYGLNSRFPVTLYKEQWRRLIDSVPLIEAALKEYGSKLKSKQ